MVTAPVSHSEQNDPKYCRLWNIINFILGKTGQQIKPPNLPPDSYPVPDLDRDCEGGRGRLSRVRVPVRSSRVVQNGEEVDENDH